MSSLLSRRPNSSQSRATAAPSREERGVKATALKAEPSAGLPGPLWGRARRGAAAEVGVVLEEKLEGVSGRLGLVVDHHVVEELRPRLVRRTQLLLRLSQPQRELLRAVDPPLAHAVREGVDRRRRQPHHDTGPLCAAQLLHGLEVQQQHAHLTLLHDGGNRLGRGAVEVSVHIRHLDEAVLAHPPLHLRAVNKDEVHAVLLAVRGGARGVAEGMRQVLGQVVHQHVRHRRLAHGCWAGDDEGGGEHGGARPRERRRDSVPLGLEPKKAASCSEPSVDRIEFVVFVN
mmetsp:Transcript_29530/g.77704  ORF Transcript_29530/g.77704 Transcript_29530/m.77704 type:complete len:287 (-) Transcript_29530:256-1116(-)